MASETWAAGIYLERTQASVLVAPFNQFNSKIKINDAQFSEYKFIESQDSDERINIICSSLKDHIRICRVGVACYGPFASLDSGDSYDHIHEEHADPPFQGVNLRKRFGEALRAVGLNKVVVSILHDGNACALGEAVARNLPRDQVLAYVLVTEGIGFGLATGQTIHRSRVHPEIGPLSVRLAATDLLTKKLVKSADSYLGSLARLADNKSILERRDMIDKRIKNLGHELLASSFESRGYYLAQGCLALTALFAPSRIVIGCDIDPRSNCVKRVREHFSSFLSIRADEERPLREYADMVDTNSYIVEPTPLEAEDRSPLTTIGATGAFGACAAAVLSNRVEGR